MTDSDLAASVASPRVFGAEWPTRHEKGEPACRLPFATDIV